MHPLPGAAGNGAGFLYPVWDETRVVSEVSAGCAWKWGWVGTAGGVDHGNSQGIWKSNFLDILLPKAQSDP